MLVKRLRLVAVIESEQSESVDGMLLTAAGVLLFATHSLLAAAITTISHKLIGKFHTLGHGPPIPHPYHLPSRHLVPAQTQTQFKNRNATQRTLSTHFRQGSW